MTEEGVREKLCSNDPRHPFWAVLYGELLDEEAPAPRENCYCDNCFYGRDELAVEILRLKGLIKGFETVVAFYKGFLKEKEEEDEL